jgi:hypothetical protein
MKRFVLTTLMLTLVGLAFGCKSRYSGGSFSSYANPDQDSTTCVITQRDSDGRLLFAIAWTSRHGGGGSTSQNGLLTQIHSRRIYPHLDRRAVYAFQPDGKIQDLHLTDEQISVLFREMEAAGFHTSHSEFWQKEVAPKLFSVEAGNGS